MVPVEFTKNFPKTHNTMKEKIYKIMQFEWIRTISMYPPLGEDSDGKYFSNICPRYARWGIPLIGALNMARDIK